MANPAHLRIVSETINSGNLEGIALFQKAARQFDESHVLDLSNADLHGMFETFSRIRLEAIARHETPPILDLSGANLSGCNLSGCDLTGINLDATYTEHSIIPAQVLDRQGDERHIRVDDSARAIAEDAIRIVNSAARTETIKIAAPLTSVGDSEIDSLEQKLRQILGESFTVGDILEGTSTPGKYHRTLLITHVPDHQFVSPSSTPSSQGNNQERGDDWLRSAPVAGNRQDIDDGWLR